MKSPPRVLAIAGSDPSGGAGIQADIKTITMLGGYAMTAITALTVQNSVGVTDVALMSADFVIAQIDACLDDIGIDAVKLGMLGSADTAMAVAERLTDLSVPIVFDPVMVATSGGVLADDETIAAFDRLLTISTVVTPNLPELAALGGEAAVRERTANLLIKGGHASGDVVTDTLVTSTTSVSFANPRIATDHTHGTGCTLSSALATNLGVGMDLTPAVEAAIAFVREAIAAAPRLGRGNGPLGHAAVGRSV